MDRAREEPGVRPMEKPDGTPGSDWMAYQLQLVVGPALSSSAGGRVFLGPAGHPATVIALMMQ